MLLLLWPVGSGAIISGIGPFGLIRSFISCGGSSGNPGSIGTSKYSGVSMSIYHYRWILLKPNFLGKSVCLKCNPAYPIIIA